MRAALQQLLRQGLLITGITVLVFLLVRVIPGDVVDYMALEGDLTEADQTELRRDLGLAASWPAQLATWVREVLRGNLGQSLRFDQPVLSMLLTALPNTLRFAASSLSIGLILGVGVAVGGTLYPHSPMRWMVDALNVWSIAVPTFCIGLAALLLFSVWLHWLPAHGQLMPAIILGVDIGGQIVKSLHEELQERAAASYVRTARAKGLGWSRVVLWHILPNSLAVVIALGGIITAGLVGGTITLEVLFGLPGIGSLALDSIRGRDYPLVQAVILLLALTVVVVNGCTDALQRLIDPRQRS